MKSKDEQSSEQTRFSSYEYMNAFATVIQAKATLKRDKAVAEFNKSGLSPEEFNARQYRDDGKMFPKLEDGEMRVMSVIKMPEGWGTRKKINPEKVLSLYNDNLSLQEISTSLKRSEKWVKRSLSRFGVRFDAKGARLNPSDIPFGWVELKGKFAINPSEQWILEKVEEDLRQGKSSEEICRFLNGLKIKPRFGKAWIESMISKAVSTNKKLKSIFLK